MLAASTEGGTESIRGVPVGEEQRTMDQRHDGETTADVCREIHVWCAADAGWAGAGHPCIGPTVTERSSCTDGDNGVQQWHTGSACPCNGTIRLGGYAKIGQIVVDTLACH